MLSASVASFKGKFVDFRQTLRVAIDELENNNKQNNVKETENVERNSKN